MWGEGERVGIVSRCDPPGVIGPVRFLTDALKFIPASTFEEAVDRFLEAVTDEHTGYGSDRPSLRSLIDMLKAERNNPDNAAWRRVTELGFDPDEAPAALMEKIDALMSRYGRDGVEEAIMAMPGVEASTILEREIAVAKDSRWRCDFSTTLKSIKELHREPTDPPWVTAELAAGFVREALGVGSHPLRNRSLADLLGVDQRIFRSVPPVSGANPAYGLRVKADGGGKDLIALRSRSPRDRRFEATRALGDVIWATRDQLGPLAKSKTARQKFQRTFAQSLLCPFQDLMAYLNTEHPSYEDITAAAHHFSNT